MLDIKDMRQIVICGDAERIELSREFIKLFMAADDETEGNMYSSEYIKTKYPHVYEIYRLACL